MNEELTEELTEELNKPCYEKDWNSVSIESVYRINNKELKIQQRRLSFSEVEQHQFNLKTAYNDPIVYKSLLLENDLDEKVKKAKETLTKKLKKDKKKKYTDEEFALKLKDYIDISDDTKYLLYNSSMKLEENTKDINIKFIAYSTIPTLLYGGYFLLDGKQLSFNDTVKIINELDKDIVSILLVNANNLAYPTNEEAEDVK